MASVVAFEKMGEQAKSPELKSCSIGTLRKLQSKNRKTGMVVIVTQRGCAPCSPAKAAVKKAVGGRIPILEIPAEDSSCDPLLNRMHVQDTPAVYWVKGRKIKMIADGMRDDLGKDVAALLPTAKAKKK